ncbi:hypothetical protein [Rothia halotolerans]|uniref:hypothetical protein n=1 Tax=Rothia halotolerans TaxID=405770 RepID=UPI00101D7461|nr:hypothetical protein [Rothia halotolerans]
MLEDEIKFPEDLGVKNYEPAHARPFSDEVEPFEEMEGFDHPGIGVIAEGEQPEVPLYHTGARAFCRYV